MSTQHDPPPVPALPRRQLSRRDLLRYAGGGAGALGLSAVLAACGGNQGSKGAQPAAPAGSLAALAAGAEQLSLLGAQSSLEVGRQLFTFGLSTPDNRLVVGGTPRLWAALDDTGKALGPFPVRSYQLGAYDQTGDKSPRTELTSFFAAEVSLPQAGNWQVLAVIDLNGQRAAGKGGVPVVARALAQTGTRARSVPSPVATGEAALTKICTRNPPCRLHAISLDRALASGRPTVACFATPLLCQSRMCGPVVDEVIVAARDAPAGKANFIHVEEFLQPDPSKPNTTRLSPTFRAWGFDTEPWTIVIDKAGVIRGRFEGPVTAGQIGQALRPLLV
jgi:hypothetical protein